MGPLKDGTGLPSKEAENAGAFTAFFREFTPDAFLVALCFVVFVAFFVVLIFFATFLVFDFFAAFAIAQPFVKIRDLPLV